jgi:hypothetical protein
MEPSDWFVVAGLLICLALAALPVVLVARAFDQHERDRKRRTYILRFPSEMDADQVLAFIHAVSGTLRPLPFRLLGTPNLAFEVLATEEGIIHRLRVPWTHSEFILQQLRQAVPGIRIEEADTLALPDWDKVVELGQTNRTRSLRIHNANSIAGSILASTQGLSTGEAVLLQWVVSPAIPTRPPQLASEKQSRPRPFVDKDSITDRRTKLAEPNIAAIVRIAASAMTDARAGHLVFRLRAALASVRSPHTRFRQSFIFPSDRLRHRVTTGRGPVVFPMTLAASELVPLLAWPIGEPHIAGLPHVRARQLPPSAMLSSDGLKVAVSNWPGQERDVAIDELAATKHIYLCGRTGVGKTTLLSNMALEAIDSGAGLIALESKGDRDDFFHTVLRGIPKSRVDDVIVMDVADFEYPVGFNVLAQGSHEVIASDLQGIFESMYGRGLRADKSLYHGLMTLMTSKAAKQPMTFVDLVPLFSPMGVEETAFADEMVRGLRDPYLRNFWQEVDNKSRMARDNYFQSIQSRIWQLNNRPEIRRIIGQSRSSFDMAEVIKQRKILLVNLAGLADTADLLGTLLVDAVWRAVKQGAADPEHPTYLVLDEFQNFLHLPISIEAMMAQARAFGLSLVLAHQQLSQLTEEMRSAVLGNARNKIIFQTYSKDAKAFAEEFGKRISSDDLISLGPYEVVCQLLDKAGASQLVTGMTRPPLKRPDIGERVRDASRDKYGRAAWDVELGIRQRRSVTTDGVKQRRPKIGGRAWQDIDKDA